MHKRKIDYKKIFIVISAIFIISLVAFYGSRLIYYYAIEHKKSDDNENKTTYFTDLLETTINVSDASGGLYINNDEYIYKYNAEDNYVWYSGALWRMLRINADKTIDLIMDEPLSIIYPSYEDNDYLESYLNKFYQDLDQTYLDQIEYCSDSVSDLTNITCTNKIKENISLIDIYHYNEAGGSKSFLNKNQTTFTMSKDLEGKLWYLNGDGSLNLYNVEDGYKALSIRPVIRLKAKLNIKDGNGFTDNPYILKESETLEFKDVNVGEYVKFNDQLYRILNKGETYIQVLSLECLKESDACIEKEFGTTNDYSKSSLNTYLNEKFSPIENNDFLVEGDFKIGEIVDYDFENINNKTFKAKVGIPSAFDYFITNNHNSYLLNKGIGDTIYTLSDKGTYFFDMPSNLKNIYPVLNLDINLKITGTGTMNDPYVVSR